MMTMKAKIIATLVAVVLWTGGAFWAGWEWRDRSSDLAVAEGQVEAVTGQRDAVVEVREDDKASQAHAAEVEAEHVVAQGAIDDNFRVIEVEVVKYVQANPDPAGCDLGPDGLSAWRAANAGRSDHPEPVDPAGAAAAGAGDPAATGRR